MNLRLRRLAAALVVVAGIYTGFHFFVGLVSLRVLPMSHWGPVIAALLLYAAATVASLWQVFRNARMRLPVTIFALAVAVTVPLLVTSAIPEDRLDGRGFVTWHIGAVCALLTIVCVRGRVAFAWWGVAVLALETLMWAGPVALLSLGLFGSAIWIGVGQLMSATVRRALDDSARFAAAERAATDWQAAQLAHLTERQFRLGQTGVRAMPMLQRIRDSGGELDELERKECLWLEGAIRDEIRGRRLLDDRVREQIMLARRRGIVITLLDEGGIDDLDEVQLARVHGGIAHALKVAVADRIIVRTVPGDGETAVTLVGLKVVDGGTASVLARDDVEDEVEFWIEIPRFAPV